MKHFAAAIGIGTDFREAKRGGQWTVTGTTHAILGADLALAASAALLVIAGPTDCALLRAACMTGGAALGALLPDIDCPHSTVGRVLFFVSYPFSWIAKLFRKMNSDFWGEAFGHRGMTHSLLMNFLLLLLLLVPAVRKSMTLVWTVEGLVVGAVSHLLADTLNPTGVPMLWPFARTRIAIGHIVTGSLSEKLVRMSNRVIRATLILLNAALLIA